MSTFDGFVKEFPSIQIDYFHSNDFRPTPTACFLSHVHSDHLLGLDTLKMPFVYCSATTRRMLLRMEKYPHRINLAKGILESRKQHWRGLKRVLRPLPLQTPTTIELTPKESIQVTLIDANHCPGAVMFLVEGGGKAILYTGDVRAEAWWVNSIVQIPALLPYSCGFKRLDCIYLDTTFASHHDRYRKFPSKAEGLRELMNKVDDCVREAASRGASPPKFYFRAWTLGYEHVWMTLANMLRCKIHVDAYQLRLFDSSQEEVGAGAGYSTFEEPSLLGFRVGNNYQAGCLTTDTESQIHSCEPGLDCHQALMKEAVVWITPIISRLSDGTELREIGAGGGGGDLYSSSELDVSDFLEPISEQLIPDAAVRKAFQEALDAARENDATTLSLEGLGLDGETEVSLKDFLRLISQKKEWTGRSGPLTGTATQKSRGKTITFPFSRHSSLSELRHLVQNFHPRDLHANTVDLETWSEECSLRTLFGDLCSEKIFAHDAVVRTESAVYKAQQKTRSLKRKREMQSQEEQSQHSPPSPSFRSAHTSPIKDVEAEQIRSTDGAHTSPIKDVEAEQIRSTDGAHTSPIKDAEPEQIRSPGSDKSQSTVEASDIEIEARVTAIRAVFDSVSGGAQVITIEDDDVDAVSARIAPEDSQTSLTSSAFASQTTGIMPRDGTSDATPDLPSANVPDPSRQLGRRDAYERARQSLRRGDSGPWADLNLRSAGSTGHSEPEMEL